MSKKDSQIL